MSDARDCLRAWLTLLDTANIIKKQIDGQMRRQFGLSLSRFDVLAALDRAGDDGLTARQLSDRLKVTDGNTTQITAPLIADGLIGRKTHAEDRRVAIFTLTKAGKSIFAETAAANRSWVAQIFSGLSDQDLASLKQIISSIEPLSEPLSPSGENEA